MNSKEKNVYYTFVVLWKYSTKKIFKWNKQNDYKSIKKQ